MCVKCLSSGGSCSDLHIISAMQWAVDHAKWPSYWDDPRSELKDYPSIFFSYSYSDYETVDRILAAIAGTQKMLYLYGYNADAEEEKKRPAVSHIQPLEGQISMLSAS